MAIGEFLKTFAKDVQGSFAVLAAGSFFVILMVTGIAIDYTRVSAAKGRAQDQVDTAVLAAAIYLKHAEKDGLSDAAKLANARIVVLENLATWVLDKNMNFSLSDVIIKDGQITVKAVGNVTPVMLSMFGVKNMSLDTSASASLAAGNARPIDVDVVLISDITGSMGDTLASVQKNMKSFSDDLTAKLLDENIEPSRIRVQVIFYKDYFADSNPMNISAFYELPFKRGALDRYVDGFVARGGGDIPESGLEAVWFGVNAPWDARTGNILTRAIVLWTDAPALDLEGPPDTDMYASASRGFASTATATNTNADNGNDADNSTMRSFATATAAPMTMNATANYPANMPRSLNRLQTEFDQFHKVNSNNQPGVVSMSINITTGRDMDSYPNWDTIRGWNGVSLHNNSLSGSEAYGVILDQVVLSVLTQATAREIAITQ